MYEGLLDHTAVRALDPVLGLTGTRHQEPEILLARLEELRAKGEDPLLEFLKEETGRSVSALRKALGVNLDPLELQRLRTACQNNQEFL